MAETPERDENSNVWDIELITKTRFRLLFNKCYTQQQIMKIVTTFNGPVHTWPNEVVQILDQNIIDCKYQQGKIE